MLSCLEENQVILQTTDKFSVDYKAQIWRPVSASHTQELFNWARGDKLLLVPFFAVIGSLVDQLLLIPKLRKTEY
jgi:hypothetical protein